MNCLFHRKLFIHKYIFLQLADEEAGSEEADTLGEDVFRHDVDQGRDEDESHGGLVDEEEGDELRHGGLEDGLAAVSVGSRPIGSVRKYHLLRILLVDLALGGSKSWAGRNRWADESGLAESPSSRAEEA